MNAYWNGHKIDDVKEYIAFGEMTIAIIVIGTDEIGVPTENIEIA